MISKLIELGKKGLTYLAERTLEKTSAVGYVIAALDYYNWSPTGDTKVQFMQWAAGTISFLLFVYKHGWRTPK